MSADQPSVVMVTSESNPLVQYAVDCKSLTCTCPAYSKGHKVCKHLLEACGPILSKQVTTDTYSHLLKANALGIASWEQFVQTRPSPLYLLRDFLYCAEAAVLGIDNRPEDRPLVATSAVSLCQKVLEPLAKNYGEVPSIVHGYECRTLTAMHYPHLGPRGAAPLHWDRRTFGDEVFARVEFRLVQVDSGKLNRTSVAQWIADNLDHDMVVQWHDTNVFAVSIAPKPRRIWMEWFPEGEGYGGTNNRVYRGVKFWTKAWPTLAHPPKFGPSATGGKMTWD